MHEILGPGSTEERTSLAGVLATAKVAGQTQTYALSLTLGAYPRRTPGVPWRTEPAAGVTKPALSAKAPAPRRWRGPQRTRAIPSPHSESPAPPIRRT